MRPSRTVVATALAGLVLAGTAFGQEAGREAVATEVFGRLHFALVHFPVALITVAFFLEILAMLRSRPVSPTALACVNIGWMGGLVTLASGWYLATVVEAEIEATDPIAWLLDRPASESPDETLYYHAWTGLAGTALALVLSFFGWRASRRERASVVYRVGLAIAAGLIGFAGHLGGKMVHGEDWLSVLLGTEKTATREHDEDGPRRPTVADGESEEGETEEGAKGTDPTPAKLVDFRRDVEPILARACYECHGERRGKGHLRLHTREAAFPADPAEWTIIPGKPDDSEFMVRIVLEPSSPDFMPKKGTPLTAAEIALLKRWIEEGASYGEAAAPAPTEGGGESGAVAPGATNEYEEKVARLAETEEKLAAFRRRNAAASFVARGDERLDLNLVRLRDGITEADLAFLDEYADRIVELNLARSDVGDEIVARLARLVNLEVLHLEHSAVTDAGLTALAGLDKLRYLNLVDTAVGDEGIAKLSALTGLRRLYLWQSRATRAGADALEAEIPGLSVNLGETAPTAPTEGG